MGEEWEKKMYKQEANARIRINKWSFLESLNKAPRFGQHVRKHLI